MFRTLIAAAVCSLFIASTVSAQPTVEDYTSFWKPIVGNWKMTNDADGKITTGVFNFKISRNKKCVLLYHGGKDDPHTQQLQGYDPVAKKLVAYGFAETGHFQVQTIGINGMKKGMEADEGTGGDWEMKVFGKDGSTKTTTSKWKFTKMEKDKIVMVWYDIKSDDPDQPSKLTMTIERKK